MLFRVFVPLSLLPYQWLSLGSDSIPDYKFTLTATVFSDAVELMHIRMSSWFSVQKLWVDDGWGCCLCILCSSVSYYFVLVILL